MNLTELTQLAASVGFPDPALAAAVAMAESGGDPCANGDPHNPPDCSNDYDSTSLGLWQIHFTVHPEVDASRLKDPTYNAQAAYAISDRGTNWTPWSTFNSGAYKKWYAGPSNPIAAVPWYKRVSKSEWALIAAAAGGLAGAVYVAKEQRLLPTMSTAEAAEEPYHPVAAAAIVEGVWLLIGAGLGGLAAGGTGARVGALVGGALAAPGAYAAYKQKA